MCVKYMLVVMLSVSIYFVVTLMVLGWGGAAAIAMVIARFFKDGFTNSTSTLCGAKPWFQVKHMTKFFTCMLL